MHQQLAKILIASFADPQQAGLAAGRHLARYQAEPGSEIAPTSKCGGIADRCRQGGRIQHADTGNACQAAGSIVGSGLRCELVIECFDAMVQSAPFRPHVLDQ